jgi:hypothetical protein
MQINVMPWLTIAWALTVGALSEQRRGLAIGALVLSCLPLAWNAHALSQWRGQDSANVAALDLLEREFPPDQTVYVYWGFEYLTAWHFMLWSRDPDMDGAGKLDPAPAKEPRFKWIAINGGAIRYPQWTPERHAQAIKHDIDLALDRGYRVAITDVWAWNVDELAGQLGGLSASARAPAIYTALHDNYEATPVFSTEIAGTYYELRRKSPH